MKSHFSFSKKQRNGIFSLLFLIVVFQCIFFFVDFPSEETKIDNSEFELFQKEIDSLRKVEIDNNKPKT